MLDTKTARLGDYRRGLAMVATFLAMAAGLAADFGQIWLASFLGALALFFFADYVQIAWGPSGAPTGLSGSTMHRKTTLAAGGMPQAQETGFKSFSGAGLRRPSEGGVD